MRRSIRLETEFVKAVPADLAEQTLYVSMEYATAVHKCCCGCGREVVTPLSPTDWKLTYDGAGISLYPSIGNWGFPCRSHYWIDKSAVRWAEPWDTERIQAGRAYDRRAKAVYYDASASLPRHRQGGAIGKDKDGKILDRLGDWFRRWRSR